ncbi:hypothetical protein HMPREF9374_0809 [Desmospora sp. 8437]|nr:hypothetical protein HMPREF9374_0809 [Desmospora sp. 8437]
MISGCSRRTVRGFSSNTALETEGAKRKKSPDQFFGKKKDRKV